MSGAVAAMVSAGSANAAAVSVYNFALTFDTPNPTSNTGGNSFKSSSGSATGLWNSYLATAVALGSDVIASPGSMQFAVGSNFAASAGLQLESVAGANLLGVTDFQFNVTAYTGGATNWEIIATDITNRQLASSWVSISATGQKTFAVSSFSQVLGSGFDWSKVTTLNLNVYTGGSASSFTFDSWTAVGVVPAPGALALLGAAGLVGGSRRRR
jgi:hypothetical protein